MQTYALQQDVKLRSPAGPAHRPSRCALGLTICCLWGAVGCVPDEEAGFGGAATDSVEVAGAGGSEVALPDSLGLPDSLDSSAAGAGLPGDSLPAEAPGPDSVGMDSLAVPPDSLAPDSLPLPPPTLLLPPGTRVELIALEEISTDGYRVGDAVVASVANDVTDPAGTVLIAAGTLFLGRITALAGSGGIGEAPVLEINFETISTTAYERPIETLVIEAPLTLDSVAERNRSLASGSERLVELPGRIAAGAIIAVQIREPLRLPLLPPDTLGGGDSTAVTDTLPPG